MSLTIGIPREVFPGEKRVATVPEVAEKLIKLGFKVDVESGGGAVAHSLWVRSVVASMESETRGR